VTCSFTVYGVAQPQGNKTAYVRNGRAVLVEGRRGPAREAFAGWRASIATAARDWQEKNGGVALLDGPLALAVTFFLPRPKSAAKRVLYPATRPDADKLARCMLDALTGLVIADDSRIVDLFIRKRFAVNEPPRAELDIRSLAS
jgi:crossover junction endodeoxyribonuclease RusA